jgi:O-antigen/teichoic acid export membrane protein
MTRDRSGPRPILGGPHPEPPAQVGPGTVAPAGRGEVVLLEGEGAAFRDPLRAASPCLVAASGPRPENPSLIARILRNKRTPGAGLYFLVQVFQKGVGLLLIPLYTKYMTPDQYGIVATCAAISAAVGFLFCLCIYEKVYFSLIGKEPGAGAFVASVLWAELGLALVLSPVMLAVALRWRFGTVAGVQLFPYIFYTVLFAIAGTVLNTYLLTLQATDRVGRYTVVSFLVFVGFTSLNVYLLVARRLEALSYVYAGAIVYGAASLFAVVAIWRAYGIRPSLQHARKAFAFGARLVPHNAAQWARGNADRVLLSSLLSTAETGVYGMATAYASVLFMATEAFRLVNNPRFFSLMREPDADRRKITSMLPVSLGALSGLAVVISVFAKDVFRLVLAPAYWDAYQYVPLICVSWLVSAIYINTVNVLFHHQRTGLVSVATVTGSALGTGATWLLVSRLGAWGSAGGLVVVNVCVAGLVLLFVRRQARLPWPWAPTLIACAAPAVCYVGGMSGQWPLALRATVTLAVLAVEAAVVRPYLRTLLHGPAVPMARSDER